MADGRDSTLKEFVQENKVETVGLSPTTDTRGLVFLQTDSVSTSFKTSQILQALQIAM